MASDTWWHAVTFDRSYSEADEALAQDLLLEWAEARGLRAILHRDSELKFISVDVATYADNSTVRVERVDYDRWAGYAMEFLPTEAATLDESKSAWKPLRESRLKDPGRRAGLVLRGLEEHYEPSTEETA